MSFGTAVRTVLGQYATFSGRARRSEYWWWALAHALVTGVPYLLGLVLLGGQTAADPMASQTQPVDPLGVLLVALAGLLALALFLPSLAVTVRRLHDTGRSGWWYLLVLVPFGSIVVLVFSVLDSTPGRNSYGPNPKGHGNQMYGYGVPVGYAQQGYTQQGHAQQGYAQPAPDPRFGPVQG